MPAAREFGQSIRVVGLTELVFRASNQSKDIRNEVRRELRRIAAPMARDARDRFERLQGTGPRVAKTVRLTFRGDTLALSFGGPSTPFAAGREFGAKRNWTKRHVATVGWRGRGGKKIVARNMGYSRNPKLFGPGWTGSQFDLGTSGTRLTLTDVAGRAFYPAVAAHLVDTDDQFRTYVDRKLQELRDS